MSVRARLQNRRALDTVEFVHQGVTLFGSVGRGPDGEINEIFLNVSAKVGSQVEEVCRDAAVSASLALQHGCPVDTLRSALVKDAAGNPTGAVGRVIDMLRAPQAPAEKAEASGR